MFALYSFTLFPHNVLPVTSSVLMLKENLSGRFGIFHGWIGVFHCASYRTENNNPVLKKWFQSQKRVVFPKAELVITEIIDDSL